MPFRGGGTTGGSEGGNASWGSIAGDIGNQTDLQAALAEKAEAADLDGKADAAHTHAQSDVTGLTAALDGKAASTHTHPQSDITNLTTDLAGKAAVSHVHAIADVTNLQTTLNGKAATSHSHAISDVTNLQTTLDGKAAASHSHAIADVTGLQTALDGKSASNHTHSGLAPSGGTTGQVLKKASNTNYDYSWQADETSAGGGSTSKEADYFKQVGTAPLERYYVAGVANCAPLTTGAPAIGVLHAMPFVAPRGGTVDRIAINVTTQIASGVAKLAIYSATSDTNLYPDALLGATAEFVTSTLGMKAQTVNLTLAANTLYWLVYWAGVATPTIRCIALAGCSAFLGLDNALGTTPGYGIQATLAYTTSFPATFTAGGTVKVAVPAPAIGVRFSA